MKVLIEILDKCGKVAFFGGAGVSTESGIPDFKSPGGVYGSAFNNYAPEDILHRDFFFTRPELFYKFYFEKMVHGAARPNAAHLALASLERAGKLCGVVTQNIDGLHQAAGSVRVAELHGTVNKNTCAVCGRREGLAYMQNFSPGVPLCESCGGIMKPDVVLYGEQLPGGAINDAVNIIASADCLIVGGTSLTVYPAASFLEYFRGNYLVLINRDVTPCDARANHIIRAPIGEVFNTLVFN